MLLRPNQLFWLSLASSLAVDALDFTSQSGSQTVLYGSSFGVPGISATYDYVVRSSGICCTCAIS